MKNTVFKSLWFTLTWPVVKIKRELHNIRMKRLYSRERAHKGYDRDEVHNLASRFVKRYYKIILEYKKTHPEPPSGVSEREWSDTINKMLYHLYFMDEVHTRWEFKNGLYQDKPQDEDMIHSVIIKHKNRFFELFSKYFYDLQD